MRLPLEELLPQVLLLQVSNAINLVVHTSSISGQEILLALADDVVPTMALAAFKASTNPIYTSMSDVDHFEYNVLLLEDHSASINWHKRGRMVSTGDALIASININPCTTLSVQYMLVPSSLTLALQFISPQTHPIFLNSNLSQNNQRN